MVVYEWAAAIDLSVPIFRLDHAQERSTVHIDIPSLNISVSGEGETSLEAETQALSQFAEAKDRFEKESLPKREMKSSGLNIDSAQVRYPQMLCCINFIGRILILNLQAPHFHHITVNKFVFRCFFRHARPGYTSLLMT